MTLPVRRRLRGLLVLPVVVALTLVAPPPSALAASDQAPSSQRQVTVMTRNLYLGADLTGVLGPDPFGAFGAIITAVISSQPAKRMAGVAAEIAAADPDVVALQEVATWHVAATTPDIDYDFLALLQSSLAALGEPYSVAVTQTNFDSAQQLPAQVQAYATFSDRDVILVRDAPASQVKVLDTFKDHFTAQLNLPALGTVINFRRGYQWADLKTRGKTWRVVNTHPEAYSLSDLGVGGGTPATDANTRQGVELAAALSDATMPVVLLGDLNSSPADTMRLAYARLLTADFVDSWLALGKSGSAYTCCYNGSLSGGALSSRLDHVLVRGEASPISATRVGVDAAWTSTPMWPSDHAGVVTSVSIGKQ
jgi:endonuclease/exonuclease/phosphatase family metal-dependent hydrolase